MKNREDLAREIRDELGGYNNDDKPVILLIRSLIEQLKEAEEYGEKLEKINDEYKELTGRIKAEFIEQLDMYKGLLEAEQKDCQLQRENKNAEWKRAEEALRQLKEKEKETARECAEIAEEIIPKYHGGAPMNYWGVDIANEIREKYGVDNATE